MITLQLNPGGRLYVKSQVIDYQYCGDEFETYNVYDFFADTYEAPIPTQHHSTSTISSNAAGEPVHPSARGRHSHARSKYQSAHPNANNKQCIVRSPLHRNVVNSVGRFFPSRDNPTSYPFYCASMLLLLKPWRNINTDLKAADQSWADAFAEMESTVSEHVTRILGGIQYYHDCRSAATPDQARDANCPVDNPQSHVRQMDDSMEVEDNGAEDDTQISETTIARVLAGQISPRKLVHGKHAIEVAKGARIFVPGQDTWTPTAAMVSNATGNDLM